MLILFSPSKTMRDESLLTPTSQEPLFASEVPAVRAALKTALDERGIVSFYRVSDAIAKRILDMRSGFDGVPAYAALHYFDGLVYKYLDVPSLNPEMIAYLNRHLRIASGLYGLLRPADGIRRYRLDWADPLRIDGKRLDNWWAEKIASYIGDETIINLASKEYALPIANALGRPLHEIYFYEDDGEIRRQKATPAKMARGALVRMMAEENVLDLSTLRRLTPEGFTCDTNHSDDKQTVFVRAAKK